MAEREAAVTATTEPSKGLGAPQPGVATPPTEFEQAARQQVTGPDAEGYMLVPVQTDGKAHSTLLAPWRNPSCTNMNCRPFGSIQVCTQVFSIRS